MRYGRGELAGAGIVEGEHTAIKEPAAGQPIPSGLRPEGIRFPAARRAITYGGPYEQERLELSPRR
jgi:hypothetical protein